MDLIDCSIWSILGRAAFIVLTSSSRGIAQGGGVECICGDENTSGEC